MAPVPAPRSTPDAVRPLLTPREEKSEEADAPTPVNTEPIGPMELVPVAMMTMEPEPLAIAIPVPCVSVAATGSVAEPIRSCPGDKVMEVKAFVP
jgi:hypothetical protein